MNDFLCNDKPLPNRATEYLIRWIQESGLKAGDQLPTEKELAERMNVGRSTVREAITILKSRNIVEVRRGCGTYLADETGLIEDPLGLQFVEDKIQLALDLGSVRMIIEPAVAELAAQNATEDDIVQLAYWNDQIEADIARGVSHQQSDIEFHQAIAVATKNVVIDRLMPVIREGIKNFLISSNHSQSGETRLYHREVEKYIAEHNGPEARAAMVRLLKVNEAKLRQIAQERKQKTEE